MAARKPARKIVQIAAAADEVADMLYALCDDGSLWCLRRGMDGVWKWGRLKGLPDDA